MQQRTRHALFALAASTTLTGALFGVASAQDPTTTTTEATTTTVSGPTAVNAKVTGSMRAGANTVQLPAGSAFVGEVDYGAGTFTGNLQLPDVPFEATANVPGIGEVPVTGFLVITDEGTTGTFGDDGTVEAQSTSSIRLKDLVATVAGSPVPIDVGDSCILAPVQLDLTGTYDEDAGTVAVAKDGFTIPPAGAGTCGGLPPLVPDLAVQINEALAGDNNAIDLVIDLGSPPDTPVTTTTTTVTTTTAAPPAPKPAAPAPPLPGRAAYTG